MTLEEHREELSKLLHIQTEAAKRITVIGPSGAEAVNILVAALASLDAELAEEKRRQEEHDQRLRHESERFIYEHVR